MKSKSRKLTNTVADRLIKVLCPHCGVPMTIKKPVPIADGLRYDFKCPRRCVINSEILTIRIVERK